MKKPDNVHEFDDYYFPYDPTRTEFLAEGEYNEAILQVLENVRKLKAEQEARKAKRASKEE